MAKAITCGVRYEKQLAKSDKSDLQCVAYTSLALSDMNKIIVDKKKILKEKLAALKKQPWKEFYLQ